MILYTNCKSALKCGNILSQTASVYYYFLEKGKKSSNLLKAFKGENKELNLLHS